jgi:hypothetical protein
MDPTSSLPTRDKFIRVDESDALDLGGLGVLGSSDSSVDTLESQAKTGGWVSIL